MTYEEYKADQKRLAETTGEIIELLIKKGETLKSAKYILNKAIQIIEQQEQDYEESAKIKELYATRDLIQNDFF